MNKFVYKVKEYYEGFRARGYDGFRASCWGLGLRHGVRMVVLTRDDGCFIGGGNIRHLQQQSRAGSTDLLLLVLHLFLLLSIRYRDAAAALKQRMTTMTITIAATGTGDRSDRSSDRLQNIVAEYPFLYFV